MVTKSCRCGNLEVPFVKCVGEKCQVCKAGGHELSLYCPTCYTFTHPCYGSSK